jgi:sulfoxide reductase heme-binding subunit YedZ
MRFIKLAVWLAALTPLGKLVLDGATGGLGVNPFESVHHRLGFWALTLLLASLACTPLRLVAGWAWPASIRRLLGLFAFFYATLHFSFYAFVDQFFDLRAIIEDVLEHKFITFGMGAFLCLVPLAVTSTSGSVRRLGARRWKQLHYLAYVAGSLAVIHYLFRNKTWHVNALVFAGILAVLFGIRLVRRK